MLQNDTQMKDKELPCEKETGKTANDNDQAELPHQADMNKYVYVVSNMYEAKNKRTTERAGFAKGLKIFNETLASLGINHTSTVASSR